MYPTVVFFTSETSKTISHALVIPTTKLLLIFAQRIKNYIMRYVLIFNFLDTLTDLIPKR